MANVIACQVCGQAHVVGPLPAGAVEECVRCGSVMRRRTHLALHRTAAFSLAALILYVPANLLPILQMERYGLATQNTVWSGVVALYQDGDLVVAVVVFLASILIPLLKLMGLFVLVGASYSHFEGARRVRTWIYKVIEGVGRWAMLDVFVMAVLVSLVKLGKLATIVPGPGLFAFSGVVVLTLLASASFDPELIWEKAELVE